MESDFASTSNRTMVESNILADCEADESTDRLIYTKVKTGEPEENGKVLCFPLHEEEARVINASPKCNASDVPMSSNLEDPDVESCFDVKMLKCKYCLLTFPNIALLNRHFFNIHVKQEGHTCDICYLKFKSPSEFKKHRLTHCGVKPYECYMCNKIFTSRTGLSRHNKIHDFASTSYRCSFCGHKSYDRSSYDKHIGSHSGSKTYPCTICGKSFRLVGDFNCHVKNHSEIKPFACTHCGREFSRFGNMMRHELVHKGSGSFKCSVCGSVFNYNSSLTRHIVTIHRATKRKSDITDSLF